MMRAWMALAVLLLAGSGAGLAEVRSDVRMEYYTISGRDEFELYRQMKRKGPQDYGRHALARTYSKVGYRVRLRGNGRECRVAQLEVEGRFRVVLPRLAADADAPARVRDNWHDLARRIHAHEMVHVKLYKRCMAAAERRLRQMRAPTCKQLKARIKQAWRAMMKDCKERQQAFDARSRQERRHIPFYRALARQVRARGERP